MCSEMSRLGSWIASTGISSDPGCVFEDATGKTMKFLTSAK